MDITNLSSLLTQSNGRHYKELQRAESALKAYDLWPLLREARKLDTPFQNDARPSPRQNVNVITVIGTNGGTGATTVSAHLAACLTAQQRRTIAFDFSPDNALRLHFGMDWEDATGLIPSLLENKPWHESSYRSAFGVDFIPFGRPSIGSATIDRLRNLPISPTWFISRLDELDIQSGIYVICDCPRGDSVLGTQALAASSLALIVVTPDALSYAAARSTAESALAHGAQRVAFVLNKFEPARTLDRDVSALLRTDFPSKLAPIVLHRDESIREALAVKQCVSEYAPSSQAAHDFAALALWIVASLSRAEEKKKAA